MIAEGITDPLVFLSPEPCASGFLFVRAPVRVDRQ